MNPPPPIGESLREKVLREMRLKEAAEEEGRRKGRMEAAAEFERRLREIEARVKPMWDKFCQEPTQIIERPDQTHG